MTDEAITEEPAAEQESPAAEAPEEQSAPQEAAPWEGTKVCLIARGEKDIVARRCTYEEYVAFGGAFAVEVTNEE